MPEIIIEAPFSEKEKERAEELKKEINDTVVSIVGLEKNLSQGWARLSMQLHEVREKKFWLEWRFSSFGEFVQDVGYSVRKGKSQLYQGIRIVEKLPQLSESSLTEIGISKASELVKLTAAGKNIPAELIDKAKSQGTSINDIREAVFNELHSTPDTKGKYYDLVGFYCTPDEKEEIDTGFELAKSVDPPIPHDIPDWAQRKEAILRLVREFVSSYPEELSRIS